MPQRRTIRAILSAAAGRLWILFLVLLVAAAVYGYIRDPALREGAAGFVVAVFVLPSLVYWGAVLFWRGSKRIGLPDLWAELTAHDLAATVRFLSVGIVVYEVLAWCQWPTRSPRFWPSKSPHPGSSR